MDNHIEEITNVERLSDIFTTFFEEASGSVEKIIESDFVQDAEVIVGDLGEALGEAVKTLKALKTLASIPTKLYLRKFEKVCRGIYSIPLDKRQKLIKKLGRERFSQESVFILNVINRIEEDDKLPMLVRLLEAQAEGIIELAEYRRLTVLVDRTLYSDLLYLQHNITAVTIRTTMTPMIRVSALIIHRQRRSLL